MATKIYLEEETSITFGSNATSDDVEWTTESLAGGSARQSDPHDLGAAPRAEMYRWRAYTQTQGTSSAVGDTLDVYFTTSDDASRYDNDDTTGDKGVSSTDKLNNLHYAGSIIMDEVAADTEFVASGVVRLTSRYVAAVIHNNTSSTTTADAEETKLVLTPLAYESQ